MFVGFLARHKDFAAVVAPILEVFLDNMPGHSQRVVSALIVKAIITGAFDTELLKVPLRRL